MEAAGAGGDGRDFDRALQLGCSRRITFRSERSPHHFFEACGYFTQARTNHDECQ